MYPGWSDKGHYVCRSQYLDGICTAPSRQGCAWTNKESYDLLDAYTAGVEVWELARKHRRSLGAIESQLFNEERALHQASRYMAGYNNRNVPRWSNWKPSIESIKRSKKHGGSTKKCGNHHQA